MRVPIVSRHWQRGGEFVAGRLAALGIRHLFSLPGSQVLPIWDAIRKQDISLVVPSSERNGAFMGEGYGRAAGFPAAVMNTLGPGVANEAIAMRSAQMSRAPVLFVCPAHPANKHSRLAEVFQGLDHALFFRGLCKAGFEVRDSASLADTLDRAFLECMAEPCGPVRVDISFPLLFRRGRFPAAKPPGRPAKSPSNGPIVIAESPDAVAGSLLKELNIAPERMLCPGIGCAGFGMPFALGAKFALPDTPLALITDTRFVMENLDSLALANRYRVPLQFIAAPGGSSARLEEIAALFELPVTKLAETGGLADLICGHPKAVCIVSVEAAPPPESE